MDSSSRLYAIILGIIQGITEFLPVSSSGHLIIVSWFIEGEAIPLSLNVALHFGTLSAVFLYFWKDWWQLSSASWQRLTTGKRSYQSDVLLPGLIVGTIPAGLAGLLFKDYIEAVLHKPIVVVLPLAIVGFLLWYVDKKAPIKKDFTELSIKDCLLIGIGQMCALIPGTSRSGATIICGRLLGLDRYDSARFSFMLGAPVMLGATLLKSKDLLASITEPTFYIGTLVSAIVGILAIKFFLGFLKKYGLLSFAIYRFLLAITVAMIVW